MAEDLLKSALAQALRHWRRISDDDPEVYVRRVMYHLQVSWWRRRRVSEHLMARSPELPGSDAYSIAARRGSLDDALATLSARQRAVLVLRFYEDMTEIQAAHELSCSVGTVRRHTHDGLARLRVVAPHLLDGAHALQEAAR